VVRYRKENCTFLANERQTPCERIHEVRKPVWVGGTIELPDVKDIAFVLEDGSLVVVTVKVMRTREEGHNGWETCRPRLPVHPIAKVTTR
jgi:hypothetical protein